MIVLVIFALWVGLEHLRDMLRKAFRGDDCIDNSFEMPCYWATVSTWLASVTVMTIWM